MATEKQIPTMTNEQLDRSEQYARDCARNNPEQTFWLHWIELIQIQRHYNQQFAEKLAEYREAVGPAPTTYLGE